MALNYEGSLNSEAQGEVANTLPIAHAGGDLSDIPAGSSVVLDFSASYDPDGTIETYVITQTEGNSVTLTGTGDSREYLAPSEDYAQNLIFKLVVTDDAGDSSEPVYVTHSVLAVVPEDIPPVANAGPDQSVAAGVLVQVSSSGSNDGDGTIVGWKWRETTNSGITLSSTTAENISFTSPVSSSPQTVTLELIVTDDGGLNSAPVYVDFNVAAEVVAPTLETLSIEIKGSGTGSHEVTVFLASDISTPIYSGLATFVNDRMVVESPDFSSGQQVVGLWLGNNYPATGGAFYGVVA